MELCLSNCHFFYENNLGLFQNNEPVVLSLMVALSEIISSSKKTYS